MMLDHEVELNLEGIELPEGITVRGEYQSLLDEYAVTVHDGQQKDGLVFRIFAEDFSDELLREKLKLAVEVLTHK